MTGNELYNAALDLCGLRKSDGSLPSDISDLTQRAPALINILLAENASLDGRITKTEQTVSSIALLSETLSISDILSASVLPYGLAALLMSGEDDEVAKEMKTLYASARENALSFGKARVESISEVYE